MESTASEMPSLLVSPLESEATLSVKSRTSSVLKSFEVARVRMTAVSDGLIALPSSRQIADNNCGATTRPLPRVAIVIGVSIGERGDAFRKIQNQFGLEELRSGASQNDRGLRWADRLAIFAADR